MWSKILIFVSGLLLGVGIWLFYLESEKLKTEPVTAWTNDHKADCAVVLTGSPGRVREGFDLLSQKMIRKLIISGVYKRARLREIFPQWPYYGQLNRNDVTLEKRSGTTYGNAQQTLPLVEALHCRDLVLITSKIHMYRARRIFTSVFPSDFPIYTRAIVARSFNPKYPDLFLETIKSLFYSLWAY